jgi:cytochrome c
MNIFFLQVIVQKDIPLPLPFPEWLMVGLLVISFLVHILFVNLMVGGSALVLIYQILGLKKKDYDVLAHEITKTITVNKSLAIVMGVAPLLIINTLYTTYFYTANALTGLFWIMIIPLVSLALLILYAHKYWWEKLENNKFLHISMIATVVAIFLFVPLIFLTNINLMLFPDKWSVVEGFFSALSLPNVFPRYIHFLNACLAATGLFLVWYLGKKEYNFEEKMPSLERNKVRKQLYTFTFWGSAVQFIIGPLVLFTLPTQGLGWNMMVVILSGASIAVFAMFYLWRELNAPQENVGSHWGKIAVSMSIVIIFMGTGRHLYRANALEPHQKLVAQKTAEYEKLIALAKLEKNKPKVESKEEKELPKGQKIFKENCAACHAVNKTLVGPSMIEASQIYKGNLSGLMQWIKKPGKKRDGAQMPAQSHLSEQELKDVSEWILSLK